MSEHSNREQKRLLDNLTIPTKFFTNKILKRGQLEKCWKQRVKNIRKHNFWPQKHTIWEKKKIFNSCIKDT